MSSHDSTTTGMDFRGKGGGGGGASGKNTSEKEGGEAYLDTVIGWIRTSFGNDVANVVSGMSTR